jgi:hypothetical protein
MPEKFPLTLSIPDAGLALGIRSRSAAYRAADAGSIPTIRLGPKLRRVPMEWLKRRLRAASKRGGAGRPSRIRGRP